MERLDLQIQKMWKGSSSKSNNLWHSLAILSGTSLTWMKLGYSVHEPSFSGLQSNVDTILACHLIVDFLINSNLVLKDRKSLDLCLHC